MEYRLAARLQPDHPYAWRDIFAVEDAIVRSGGPPDLAGMQQPLDHLRDFGHGQPGPGSAHIDELQDRLNALAGSLPVPEPRAATGRGADDPGRSSQPQV